MSGGTVSNPATLSSVISVFGNNGSPTNLAAYVRGGSYVPSSASSTISTTAAGLALSQFNGVAYPATLTASISPTFWASQPVSTPQTVTSASITCAVTGSTGTVTYQWSVSSTYITINNPTSSITTFSANLNSTNGTIIGVATCTITNNGQNVTSSNGCNLKFAWNGSIN